MIPVDKFSWHAKIYKWWYHAKWPTRMQTDHSNLCPYVRTVLFWGPCRWLFYQGTIGKLKAPFIFWPVLFSLMPIPAYHINHVFGKALFVMNVTLISAALVVLALRGLLYLLIYLLNETDQKWGWSSLIGTWRDDRHKKRLERLSEYMKTRAIKRAKGPSFLSLMAERIASAHDRVCPEIQFKDFNEPKGYERSSRPWRPHDLP